MFEFIAAKLGAIAVDTTIKWTIGGVIGWLVLFILKKVPNDQIKAKFGWLMYGIGVGMTLGASKWANRWKITKAVYQRVEDWFVDLVENVIAYGIAEWVRGMRSDNKLEDRTVLDTKVVKKKGK